MPSYFGRKMPSSMSAVDILFTSKSVNRLFYHKRFEYADFNRPSFELLQRAPLRQQTWREKGPRKLAESRSSRLDSRFPTAAV